MTKEEGSAEFRLMPPDETPIVAEIVENPTNDDQPEATASPKRFRAAPGGWERSPEPVDISVEFQNMAAIGGAVGALVLGSWSIVCALLTPFASINAIIAILMGIYGMRSVRKRMAWVGIALGLVGLAFSLMDISRIISSWFALESQT